jgi:hypothetical protein
MSMDTGDDEAKGKFQTTRASESMAVAIFAQLRVTVAVAVADELRWPSLIVTAMRLAPA